MKLLEKVRLVIDAIPSARGPRRVTLVSGLVWLALAAGGTLRAVVLLVGGRYADAVVWLTLVPILGVFWGEAWRRALDEPMGTAWFDLPSTRHVLAGAYGLAGAVVATTGHWGWATLNFTWAVVWLIAFRGHGGGGWDDPIDAPRPDPSTAA